ncbi:sigma 54-interacting transcriptional regulator [Lactobacillus sp. ESL0791]|uniref:sigma 54-interacting transcriptional regulator n=1 Tax=Lactobacillus sp. ESL0791 TaxID=2983234 RepID=UPI0023F72A69|nr:sigma 54-interacting transcriptional regulator [Lactobacillus sp. ESL0791]MDF7639643.1 sigma 54-interacting transcriptional regulator [Lactobacillus sp. ESL0791]
MYRKEKIYQALTEYTSNVDNLSLTNTKSAMSTADLADLLHMDRANCSKELNELFKEKLIIKVDGRPIRYFPVKKIESLLNITVKNFEVAELGEFLKQKKEDSFDTLIGNNESLKLAVDKAKAAMIYPKHGLNTILSGETGVGKTMFAQLMYKFAKSNGVLDTDAPFVTFNCSEYADNPQLLVSTLFGYTKGAYTGADQSHEGLVDKANKGILFLDEIHRLPAQGQEMLFHLIDFGQYRRLGDSENYHSAQVLIIAATTESIESVLLDTFLRRIPMTINIPRLQDRTINERFELICTFFNEEYKKINKEIVVQRSVVKSLLGYQCLGNIGQLKADINLICARAYLDSIVENSPNLTIRKKFLPNYVLDGMLTASKKEGISAFLAESNTDIVFNGENIQHDIITNDIYPSLLSANSLTEIKKRLETNILETYPSSKGSRIENAEIFKVIEPSVYYATIEALKLAENELNKKFSKQTIIAFAMHINSLINGNGGKSTLNELNFLELEKKHMDILNIAKLVKNDIEKELNVTFSAKETYIFALFLMMDENSKEKKHVGLIILAHGNGIAKNIAYVVNTLLDCKRAYALDMNLEQNVNEFYKSFESVAVNIDEGHGILLMTDMGSLNSFGEMLTEKTGILTKTITLISTPFVLEALRKTMISGYSLEEIYRDLKSEIAESLFEKNEINSNIRTGRKYHDNVIVTTCITGKGAAVTLANFLKNSLPLIAQYNIEIIPVNRKDFFKIDFGKKNLLAIVGSYDLHVKDVPFISAERVLLTDGLPKLTEIIKKLLLNNNQSLHKNIKLSNNEILIGLEGILNESLTFLNPQKTLSCVLKSFFEISNSLSMKNESHYMIAYTLHAATMIERIAKKQAFSYPEIGRYIQAHQELYISVKSGTKIIEKYFNIKIPDSELGYIIEIFDTL